MYNNVQEKKKNRGRTEIKKTHINSRIIIIENNSFEIYTFTKIAKILEIRVEFCYANLNENYFFIFC